MEHTFTIAPDHPALPGHFPGNPIVPGVVLLDEIANALQRLQPDTQLTGLELIGVPGVKFLSPLLPGEACTVRFSSGRNSTIKFECIAGDRPVASGSFSVKSSP